jgi:hypothetical protein
MSVTGYHDSVELRNILTKLEAVQKTAEDRIISRCPAQRDEGQGLSLAASLLDVFALAFVQLLHTLEAVI